MAAGADLSNGHRTRKYTLVHIYIACFFLCSNKVAHVFGIFKIKLNVKYSYTTIRMCVVTASHVSRYDEVSAQVVALRHLAKGAISECVVKRIGGIDLINLCTYI